MSLNFSIQSDVYSFGVFLVELVSGRRAVSDQHIIQWVNSNTTDALSTSFLWILHQVFPFSSDIFNSSLNYHIHTKVPYILYLWICRCRTSRNQVISLQLQTTEWPVVSPQKAWKNCCAWRHGAWTQWASSVHQWAWWRLKYTGFTSRRSAWRQSWQDIPQSWLLVASSSEHQGEDRNA